MVSYAALTDHSAVDAAMADFDKLGRELFLLKVGFPETSEAFVITETGRYDARALFAAAYEHQHNEMLTPKQVTAGMRGAAGAFVSLGYVVLSADDQKKREKFTTFDAALTNLRIPEQNLAVIRDFLSTQSYREFYLPSSRAYIGAKPRNGKPAHYIGRGSIVYREDDGRLRSLELPVRVTTPVEPLGGGPRQSSARPRVPGSSAPRAPKAPARVPGSSAPRASASRAQKPTPAEERTVNYCPTCFLALPATGLCANCD